MTTHDEEKNQNYPGYFEYDDCCESREQHELTMQQNKQRAKMLLHYLEDECNTLKTIMADSLQDSEEQKNQTKADYEMLNKLTQSLKINFLNGNNSKDN